MLKNAALFTFAALALSLSPAAAHAQWVVHAQAGTLKSVDAKAKELYLNASDGTPTKFTTAQKSDSKVEFDPHLRTETTPADTYNTVGTQVVVFYYGWGNDLTAVSVEKLGDGPFTSISGKVDKFDKHSRTLTIKTDKGEASFHVQDSAVIDTNSGVKIGAKFDPHKNDPIQIMYVAAKQGDQQAVFIQRNDT